MSFICFKPYQRLKTQLRKKTKMLTPLKKVIKKKTPTGNRKFQFNIIYKKKKVLNQSHQVKMMKCKGE